jgi:uncharacterized integral membrane protein
MRWLHIAIVVVLAAVMLIFAIQNLHTVTVAFLQLSLSAPLSILIVVIYLLGMATGGSLWALVRWALDGSKRSAVA